MALLVTGANGLLGSRVVARLAAQGEQVIAAGRGPSRFRGSGEYVELDLAEAGRLRQLIERRAHASVIPPSQ